MIGLARCIAMGGLDLIASSKLLLTQSFLGSDYR